MAVATKVVEKQELKMFRIFIFLNQKKTKPEQKDGSITLEHDIQLKVFYFKGKFVCSDHFHANCCEVDMMARYGKHIEEEKLEVGCCTNHF